MPTEIWCDPCRQYTQRIFFFFFNSGSTFGVCLFQHCQWRYDEHSIKEWLRRGIIWYLQSRIIISLSIKGYIIIKDACGRICLAIYCALEKERNKNFGLSRRCKDGRSKKKKKKKKKNERKLPGPFHKASRGLLGGFSAILVPFSECLPRLLNAIAALAASPFVDQLNYIIQANARLMPTFFSPSYHIVSHRDPASSLRCVAWNALGYS